MNRIVWFHLFIAALSIKAANPDYDDSVEKVFNFSGSPGQFSVRVDEAIQRTFHTKRATRQRVFQTVETTLEHISGYQAELNGTTLKTEIGAIESEDVFYTDARFFSVALPPTLKVGDRLSVSFHRTYKDFYYLPMEVVPNVDRLSEYSLEYHFPEDLEIDFEIQYADKALPVSIERTPGKVVLSLVDLDYRKPKAYFPFNHAHAWIIPRFSEKESKHGASATEDFAKWYRSRLNGELDVGSTAVQALLNEADAKDGTLEKLAVLYGYVQEEIRYIASFKGSQSIIPRSPKDILSTQFGDCKDRVILIQRLAKELGIDVDFTLISSECEPEFDSVNIGLFDHAICSYQGPENRIFFDPTHPTLPFETLSYALNDKKAFVISDEPGWVTTPALPLKPNELELRIMLDVSQPQQAKSTITLNGNLAAYVLQSGELDESVAAENQLSNLVTQFLRKVSCDYFEKKEETRSSLQYEAIADFSESLVTSTSKCYLPLTLFNFGDKDLVARSEDEQVIDLLPMSISLSLDFKHEGYEFVGPSKEIPILEPFGSIAYEPDGENATSLHFRIHTPTVMRNGLERQKFIKMVSQYMSHRNSYFIFRRRT